MNFDVSRGDELLATVRDTEVAVSNDQNADCRLVLALLSLGVPQEKNTLDRQAFWRVQVSDGDFVLELTRYLGPHGLRVVTPGTGMLVAEPGSGEEDQS